MPSFIDLSGKQFGLLTVQKRSLKKVSRVHWVCMCLCGKLTCVAGNNLTTGKQTSCGCNSGKTTKHGHAIRGAITREYRSWNMMMNRCYNENYHRYQDWGGRGITVCKRWHDFENFLSDMGSRPVNKTLDRIHNDKPYSKRNCKWSTVKEQNANRRPRTYS